MMDTTMKHEHLNREILISPLIDHETLAVILLVDGKATDYRTEVDDWSEIPGAIEEILDDYDRGEG